MEEITNSTLRSIADYLTAVTGRLAAIDARLNVIELMLVECLKNGTREMNEAAKKLEDLRDSIDPPNNEWWKGD